MAASVLGVARVVLASLYPLRLAVEEGRLPKTPPVQVRTPGADQEEAFRYARHMILGTGHAFGVDLTVATQEGSAWRVEGGANFLGIQELHPSSWCTKRGTKGGNTRPNVWLGSRRIPSERSARHSSGLAEDRRQGYETHTCVHQ